MGAAFQSNAFQLNAFQPATVYSLSLTDGLKLGDTTVYLFETNPALTTGLSLGDTPVSAVSFQSLLTDGIILGEGHRVSFQSDGFQNNAFQIVGMPYYVYEICPVATDGVTLGEALAHLFETNPALTDGIKLSDGLVIYLLARAINLTLKIRELGLRLWP